MPCPVKEYVAIQNGETKIKILVYDIEGICYGAVMIPFALEDARVMSLFKEHKIPQEVGKTIELAIAACETWIRTNLGQHVAVLGKPTI